MFMGVNESRESALKHYAWLQLLRGEYMVQGQYIRFSLILSTQHFLSIFKLQRNSLSERPVSSQQSYSHVTPPMLS